MIRLVLRSSVGLLTTALAASFVLFVLLHSLTGDIANVMLGINATAEGLAKIRHELGLDQPLLVQYGDWITGIFRGDLGNSFIHNYDISAEVKSRLAVTLILVIPSILLGASIALIAGTYAAIYVRKRRGALVDLGAQIGYSTPAFLAGFILILIFSIRLGWLPSGGYTPWSEDPRGAVRSMVLPVISLTIPITGSLTRYVRAGMLDVLGEDYIRTAMAKGRTLRGAALVHGVRNAAVPLVTVTTLQLGILLAGAVVVENVFTLPGLGKLLVVAVGDREVIVVQSFVFVILLLILGLNFLMDVAYGIIDPRIRDAHRDS